MATKKWTEGTALATRAVLAGAYRGKDVSDRVLLTHAILVDATGFEVEEKTLCRKVLVDRLADQSDLSAPTCLECAKRAAR